MVTILPLWCGRQKSAVPGNAWNRYCNTGKKNSAGLCLVPGRATGGPFNRTPYGPGEFESALNAMLREMRAGLVAAGDELANATSELAERLAQGPTLAYGFAKASVYQSASLPFESLLDLEARNQQIAGRSHDASEGVRAFIEGRKPKFRGR